MATRSSAGTGLLRSLLRVIGGAAVLGACAALFLPLQLGAVDRAGHPIACGHAVTARPDTARHVDQINKQLRSHGGVSFIATDYEGDCALLVADRRLVAASVAAGGAVVLLAAMFEPAPRRNRARVPLAVSPVAAAR